MLLSSRSLQEGEHLPKVLRATTQGELGTRAYGRRPRRYDLRLPPTTRTTRFSTNTAALSFVFGNDDLGKLATSLFQSALSDGTEGNYDSNLGNFYA